MEAELAGVKAELSRLGSMFAARMTYDATKETAFQHLYADLQDAKLATSLEATRPLLLDLLLLFDRVDAAISGGGPDASALNSFRDELLELLYRRDVRRLVSTSDRFDPETQQVVGTVEAGEPLDHQRVDRVVRAGFRWGTRLLRAEDVVIRSHRRLPTSAGGTQ